MRRILHNHSFYSAASILSAISEDLQSGGSNCKLEVDKEEVKTCLLRTQPPLCTGTIAHSSLVNTLKWDE